jgi:hypothetical protein
MDRITQQVSELSDYERFQLLLRLAGDVPNSTFQSKLSAIRGRRAFQRDLPVTGYVLNGMEAQEQPA